MTPARALSTAGPSTAGPAAAAACALPAGFGVGVAGAAIKKPGRMDMALLRCAEGTALAAVFTTNRVRAAPIDLSAQHLKESAGRCSALLINSGCANAATGPEGMHNARTLASAVAAACGCPPAQVQQNSTGVIGVQLPMDRMLPCIAPMADEAGRALAHPAAHSASSAAEPLASAIMTTDTYPKLAERTIAHEGRLCRVVGIAKGAGMIHPNMATMIAVLMTDAEVAPMELDAHLRSAVERSFHRISIDGDTSTNDSVFALASGRAGAVPAAPLREALTEIARDLALMVVRDGEGFERALHVRVAGAASQADALAVARAVATSLLVRCAVTGGDPNWGRIVAAAGRSGVAVDLERMDLRVGGVPLLVKGTPSDAPLADRQAAFRSSTVQVDLDLGLGSAADEFISCGLTKAYVELNADYTT